MGTQFYITILSSPQVGLVQAIPIYVRGKRRVQKGFKVLSQKGLSDGMEALVPLTEVEVPHHKNGILEDVFIEDFHQV